MQHLSAVHQRVFRLQQVGQAVELLEPGIGVMLAVRGMTGTSTAMTYLATSFRSSVPNATREIRALRKAPRA